MNALNRHPLGLLFGILLAFALTTHMAQGQAQPKLKAPQQLPPLLPPGTPHHVIGSVEKGACPVSLDGATLEVVESWYSLGVFGGNRLTLGEPFKNVPPSGYSLDPLSFTGRPLLQRRVLGGGGVTLTGDAATFDIQWLEVPFLTRVPWVQNVQNGRTGEIITVYRLLKLEGGVTSPPNYVLRVGSPVPLIMFFGTETMKNVGRIKVDCFLIGG